MTNYIKQHHVGIIALLMFLLGGTSAYAAATIGPEDIQNNAVRTQHIAPNQIRGSDVNESDLSVSRVVNRGIGTADQVLSNASLNSYPLVSGRRFIQRGNETLTGVVGQIRYVTNNCAIGAAVGDIFVSVLIDDFPVGLFAASADIGGQSVFNSGPDFVPLFEPGSSKTRTLSLKLSQQCSSGGPVVVTSARVNILGVR